MAKKSMRKKKADEISNTVNSASVAYLNRMIVKEHAAWINKQAENKNNARKIN